jgi:hypothetical protein
MAEQILDPYATPGIGHMNAGWRVDDMTRPTAGT